MSREIGQKFTGNGVTVEILDIKANTNKVDAGFATTVTGNAKDGLSGTFAKEYGKNGKTSPVLNDKGEVQKDKDGNPKTRVCYDEVVQYRISGMPDENTIWDCVVAQHIIMGEAIASTRIASNPVTPDTFAKALLALGKKKLTNGEAVNPENCATIIANADANTLKVITKVCKDYQANTAKTSAF